jgi:hypothetical protein
MHLLLAGSLHTHVHMHLLPACSTMSCVAHWLCGAYRRYDMWGTVCADHALHVFLLKSGGLCKKPTAEWLAYEGLVGNVLLALYTSSSYLPMI